MEMLLAHMPGYHSLRAAPDILPESDAAVTAVDAAMQQVALSGADESPSESLGVLMGADNVQWTVTDTNELDQLIRGTNEVIESVVPGSKSEVNEPVLKEPIPVG